MNIRVRLWDSGREDCDAVQLRCEVVSLRADDPELIFAGAHEYAAVASRDNTHFTRQLAGDRYYGLCGSSNLQQGKAAGFADLQDGACIGPGAGEGGATVKH